VFKNVFGGSKEQRALDSIKKHMQILSAASDCFKKALGERSRDKMFCVTDLEREGDSVRREIISIIYEGAFLPFIRTNICRFVEIVDEALDALEDAAYEFENLGAHWDEGIRDDCLEISDINQKMCEMLMIAFETLWGKGDLREKTLAVRIYEKRIDEIKFDVLGRLRKREVKDFWEGKALSDFISYLTRVSDVIEDASDYLHIINLSMR